MTANRLNNQVKNLKIQRAKFIRQISDLNCVCEQYPEADCGGLLTQRERLYDRVKNISKDISNVLEQMNRSDFTYQYSYLTSSSIPFNPIQKKGKGIADNFIRQRLGT